MKIKKCISRLLVFFILIFNILFLCGFGVSDVVTDNPRKYIYKAKETINFYDNYNTKDHLGTLTIVSMHVLSNKKFKLKNYKGTDETYRQIIQVNYVYNDVSGEKEDITPSFRIYDTNNVIGEKNPQVNYKKVSVSNMSSVVVALKSKSDIINVEVFYSGIIAANATVQLSTTDKATSPPKNPLRSKKPTQKDINELKERLKNKNNKINSLRNQIESKDNEINSLQDQIESKNNEINSQKSKIDNMNTEKLRLNSLPSNAYKILIFILLYIIIILIIVIIIIYSRLRRNQRNTTLLR